MIKLNGLKDLSHKIGENASNILAGNDICFHFFEEPEEGRVGIFVYDENNPPLSQFSGNKYACHSYCFTNEIFDKSQKVKHSSFQKFKEKLDKYTALNYYLIRRDNLSTLEIGFVCLKSDGNEWHTVGLNKYERLSKEEKNNIKENILFAKISATSFLKI